MIPLFTPFVPSQTNELFEVLHSGRLSCGTHVAKFEKALASYIGNPYVTTVNSFNSAIYIALKSLGIDPGSEVIVSPIGCMVSVLPLKAFGYKIVWADVDPCTGTLSVSSVAEKITKRTRAIIHNCFCGYTGHIEEISFIARERGIALIEDGIEAFGSITADGMIGSRGADATLFSFGPVRIPNTIDGAAVFFSDERCWEKSRKLRDSGIDRSTFRDAIGEISLDSDVADIGIAACMNEVEGCLGVMQMDSVKDLLAIQRRNALAWCEWCDLNEIKRLVVKTEASPNYWVFGVLFDKKAAAIEAFKRQGICASGIHIDVSDYSVFKESKAVLPGAKDFSSRFLGLPTGWWTDINEAICARGLTIGEAN